MLNKIKRFLLRQKGVEFIKKSEQSSSLYFAVGDRTIRVSDHIPISQCRPDELHILVAVNSECFTILVNNRVAIIPNYNKLKEYIKFYILTVGVMGRTVYSVVTKEVTVKRVQEVTKEIVVPVYKEVDEIDTKAKKLLTDYNRLCPQHRQSILNMLGQLVNAKASKNYRKHNNID